MSVASRHPGDIGGLPEEVRVRQVGRGKGGDVQPQMLPKEITRRSLRITLSHFLSLIPYGQHTGDAAGRLTGAIADPLESDHVADGKRPTSRYGDAVGV